MPGALLLPTNALGTLHFAEGTNSFRRLHSFSFIGPIGNAGFPAKTKYQIMTTFILPPLPANTAAEHWTTRK
jgi:hypothetical protein